MIEYKIVKDNFSEYNVMYKKRRWGRWHYCRRPKGQSLDDSGFDLVWRWSTEKGAQAFINQKLKNENI